MLPEQFTLEITQEDIDQAYAIFEQDKVGATIIHHNPLCLAARRAFKTDNVVLCQSFQGGPHRIWLIGVNGEHYLRNEEANNFIVGFSGHVLFNKGEKPIPTSIKLNKYKQERVAYK